MSATQPPREDDERPGPGATLAERLDYLFRRVHPPTRGEYTLEEVATGIRERRNVPITPAYLSQLRRGQRANPSYNVVEALADFFGVDPNFFFDTAAAQDTAAQLELYAVLRDAQVRHIALRAAGLSPESLRDLANVVERWRQLEGAAGRREKEQGPEGRSPADSGSTG